MSELTKMTLSAARDALHKGEISAVEITKAHLAAIEDAKELNSYIMVTDDQALEMRQRPMT